MVSTWWSGSLSVTVNVPVLLSLITYNRCQILLRLYLKVSSKQSLLFQTFRAFWTFTKKKPDISYQYMTRMITWGLLVEACALRLSGSGTTACDKWLAVSEVTILSRFFLFDFCSAPTDWTLQSKLASCTLSNQTGRWLAGWVENKINRTYQENKWHGAIKPPMSTSFLLFSETFW